MSIERVIFDNHLEEGRERYESQQKELVIQKFFLENFLYCGTKKLPFSPYSLIPILSQGLK